MKVDWKIYLLVGSILVVGITALFLQKIFYFLTIALVTGLLAVLLGFLPPLKYIGIELVTLTTILVGIVYGPMLSGIYGFTLLIIHLILGRYYIGSYLVWLFPEYVLLGILSGIFKSGIIGIFGISFIVTMNVLNFILTAVVENDRIGSLLPYVIGNTILNSLALIWFLNSIVKFIG